MGCRNIDIPEDIVTDILSRLPGKDILRFRCVSTSWNAIIDSRYFVRMRYDVSIRGNYNCGIFFRNLTPNCVYTLHLNDSEGIEISNYPFKWVPENTQVLRSCNGLFLINFSETRKEKYAIWNPSTRECKELPELLMSNNISHALRAYGFCYESVGDDYKVVLVYSFYSFEPRFSTTFHVYSLKLNTWQQIKQDYNACLYNSDVDVFVGGALHWVGEGEEDDNELIFSFDIITAEIRVMPKPSYPNNIPILWVGELEGCLCFSICDSDSDEFWLMKDYGVQESWIKLFSISQLCFLYPKYKTGTKFLFADCKGRYLLHDLTKRTTTVIRHVEVINVPEYANNFLENLVRLRD